MSSTARSSLVVGGVGIVLASLVPLWTRVSYVFPQGFDVPSVAMTWQPYLGVLSAAVLVASFAVLAFGVRGGTGVAGSSLVGKIALVLFALCTLVVNLVGFVPLPTLPEGEYTGLGKTDLGAVILLGIASFAVAVLGTIALAVASIVVLRAGVVHGVARWGLVVLAVVSVLSLLVNRIPVETFGVIAFWGFSAELVVQLLLGIAFVVQRQRTAPSPTVQTV